MKYKYHFVYLTTNLINGKKYLGKHSTNTLEDGYLGSGTIINKAIKKYGKENFKREILEFCDSLEEAYNKEELTIKEYCAVELDEFYNLTKGGKGNKGYVPKFTEEWIKKISEGLKGKHLSDKHKENISKSCKGREVWNKDKRDIYSNETKSNISKGLKEYFKINGVKEETKIKLSKAFKGRVSPMKGKKHSPETIMKIKQNSKGSDENFRKKVSEGTKLYWKNKEKLKCYICGHETINPSVLKRWHNENCKYKAHPKE